MDKVIQKAALKHQWIKHIKCITKASDGNKKCSNNTNKCMQMVNIFLMSNVQAL